MIMQNDKGVTLYRFDSFRVIAIGTAQKRWISLECLTEEKRSYSFIISDTDIPALIEQLQGSMTVELPVKLSEATMAIYNLPDSI